MLHRLLFSLLFLFCIFDDHGSAQDKRPNILLIVADDAGLADLGSFGSEISTPNIDAIASTGIRFTNFYTGPTCSPTRAMLLTGVDNHRAGFGNMAEFLAPNQKGRQGYEGYLNKSVAPLPALLRQAGYHTYMAGKWHMGDEPAHFPAARGFERDFSLIPGGGSHFDDMWGAKGEKQLYTRNGLRIETLRADFHSSDDYTSAIIDNIEENRTIGKPFFAYLALQAPHDPFHLPDEWRDKYKGRYDQGYDVIRAERIARMKKRGILRGEMTFFPRLPNIPAWDSLSADEKKQSARRMELYAGMVEHMDFNIGRIIRYLKDKDLFDDTLIVFLSDNGPEGNTMNIGGPWDNSRFEDWGRRGTFIQYGAAWAQAGVGPLRMFKGFTAEGGIRAPMIMSGYGVSGSGRLSDALTHVMDVPATILTLAGVNYPSSFDGVPIVPLQGKSLGPILNMTHKNVRGAQDWLGWELFGNRAIRQGNWKILWLCTPFGTSQWQLYDLAKDPGETINLAERKPKIRDRLVKHWRDYAQNENVILPNESPLCRSVQ
jgi:arylsulfatase A-like enzyme